MSMCMRLLSLLDDGRHVGGGLLLRRVGMLVKCKDERTQRSVVELAGGLLRLLLLRRLPALRHGG